MPDVGKVRSRVRMLKGGPKTFWFIDFSPHLQARERFLYGVMGQPFTSSDDANRIRTRICDAVTQGKTLSDAAARWRQPDAKPNLFLTFVHRWLDERAGDLAPKTLSDYRSIVKNHFAFWDGESAADVQTPTVRAWVRDMRERGIGEKAIKNALVPMRSAHTYYREEHPETGSIVWPKVKVPRTPKRPMPLDDVLATLDALKIEDRGVFLCCFWTLCRPGEARGLTMQAYEWKTGLLTVAEALKTSSGVDAVRDVTKTGEGGEYPLPDEMREWIAEHRGDVALDRAAPLFPNPRTGHPYSQPRIWKLWKAATIKAGVEYVSPYRALKASPGTALLEAGLSLSDLQAAFRHKSSRTTMIYDLEDRQRRERAVKSLESIVGDSRETANEEVNGA